MSEKLDVYSRVTNKIVADLERANLTWLQPWQAGHQAGPVSRPLRAGGKAYRGVNVLMLWAAAMEKGYSCPLWLTYNQAAELGGQVRKGEHGSLVVYADKFTKEGTDDKGAAVEIEIPFMKGYTVFNHRLGHGIVFAFGLDQKVANVIRVAMTPEWRQAISWALAGAFGLVCLAGWEFWSSRTVRHGRGSSLDWDIPINDALDYIVNDSRETFPPPRTMTIRGVSVPASGTQHQAALSRLNQRLIFGELDISGHREIVPADLSQFRPTVDP